jgi:hypothetical protein
MIMPTRLPDKPRAKTIPADKIHPSNKRELHFVETIDWLALWALSIGFSAMVLAALVFYGGYDATGAAMVLAGAAGVMALALFVSAAPSDRS